MSQFLYAVLTIPSIFISFLNDPLYKIILGGATEAKDYDFTAGKSLKKSSKPKLKFLAVSYGMAAASGVCIFSVIYMFFDIKKMVSKKESDWASSGSPKIEKRISLQEEGDENLAFDSIENKYELENTDF